MMRTAALLSSSLTAFFFLLLASVFLSLASSTEPPPSSCANELVRFSPCLSYVSSPPNNLSDSPASKCCDAFLSAEDSGSVVCLCYLVQDPPMLGFPVAVARLLSLPSLCPRRNSTAADVTTANSSSLKSLCSEVPELPPLRISAIPVNIDPPHLSGPETTSPPPPNPPNPANESTTQPSSLTPPSSAVEPARGSADLPRVASATARPSSKSSTGWILSAILMLVLICV